MSKIFDFDRTKVYSDDPDTNAEIIELLSTISDVSKSIKNKIDIIEKRGSKKDKKFLKKFYKKP